MTGCEEMAVGNFQSWEDNNWFFNNTKVGLKLELESGNNRVVQYVLFAQYVFLAT